MVYRHRLFAPKRKRALDEVNRQLLEETRDARADAAEYLNPFFGKGTEYDPRKQAAPATAAPPEPQQQTGPRRTTPRKQPAPAPDHSTYYLRLAEKIVKALHALTDIAPRGTQLHQYCADLAHDMGEVLRKEQREKGIAQPVTAAAVEDTTWQELTESLIKAFKLLQQHVPKDSALKAYAEHAAGDLEEFYEEAKAGTPAPEQPKEEPQGEPSQQQNQQQPEQEKKEEAPASEDEAQYSGMFDSIWQEAQQKPGKDDQKIEQWKSFANSQVAWASYALPDQQWVVWWLRWVRMQAEHEVGTQFDRTVAAYKQRAGRQVGDQDFQFSQTLPWKRYQERLQEYMKLDQSLRDYDPGWKAIWNVLDDLKKMADALPKKEQPQQEPEKKRKSWLPDWRQRKSRFGGYIKQSEIDMHETPRFLPPRHDARKLLDEDIKDEMDEEQTFVPPTPGRTRQVRAGADDGFMAKQLPFQAKLPGYERCWSCNRDGQKHLRGERRKGDCPECDGSGYVYMPGLKDRNHEPAGALPRKEPSPPPKREPAQTLPSSYRSPWRRDLDQYRNRRWDDE